MRFVAGVTMLLPVSSFLAPAGATGLRVPLKEKTAAIGRPPSSLTGITRGVIVSDGTTSMTAEIVAMGSLFVPSRDSPNSARIARVRSNLFRRMVKNE